MFRIESLLSARLFLRPQEVGDRIFFISNLNGQLSLYAMDYGGSIPEPLLPPQIALQNPHLITGFSFFAFGNINKILVMIDRDGDENYQPMLIPLDGGFPEPAFNNYFSDKRVHFIDCDPEKDMVYFAAESRQNQDQEGYQGNLITGELIKLGTSIWGSFPFGRNESHDKVILADSYTAGDVVLYLWEKAHPEKKLLFGVPLEERIEGQEIQTNGISKCCFTHQDQGLILLTALFDDSYGLAYLALENPKDIKPIKIDGVRHKGAGELVNIIQIKDDRYYLEFNIDGTSWVYEGYFDFDTLIVHLEVVVVGMGRLCNGVLDSIQYNYENNRYIASYSKATSPTQIYTISGSLRDRITRHTREKVLGIAEELFSEGEDASFVTYDGHRISARLYLPAKSLGYVEPLPLVYYVHGGPQGQERPDFAWFSMPLIQYLTLNGFAVFVPNVRGSTGYGLNFMKQVDRDWGGYDRLDHVHAMKILAKDKRIDVTKAGVVGRSYGGYMSLTLASRHPELWSAAVDMFGPYDLLTFCDRIPPTWKPYFEIALGSVEKDHDFLVERSPRTYIDQIQCPLFVIQGTNDPRVVEKESHDLVDHLKANGKKVDYLVFENEGHDVLKYENRVKCYNAISEFFSQYLKQ